jgi:hypothetical protein
VSIASQLGLEVTISGDVVSFTFTNDVSNGIPATIAEIWFHEDLGDSLTNFAFDSTNSVNTVFGTPVSPAGPPGLSWPGVLNDGYESTGADFDSSSQTAVFTAELASGVTFDDLLALLNNEDGASGALIAMHVTGLPGYESDGSWSSTAASDVYYNSTVVPEPGTIVLLGLGLVGVVGGRQWRKRRA